MHQIYVGDSLEKLKLLPDDHFHCCITSPPYYNLRDYGKDGQIGNEETLDMFIANLVAIFEEVHRVLRPDGTFWLNLGDSYAGSQKGYWKDGKSGKFVASGKQVTNKGSIGITPTSTADMGFKDKDLMGVPWAVAFSLRQKGWWLRRDIIWQKTNSMCESVYDRDSSSHEYIFMLTKSKKYFYDFVAAKEMGANGELRHRRSIWTFSKSSYVNNHFATFPVELPMRCLNPGTSYRGCCSRCGIPWSRIVKHVGTNESNEDGIAGMIKQGVPRQKANLYATKKRGKTITVGWELKCKCKKLTVPCRVLDPFSGAATTGLAASRMGREYTGIELNPVYAKMGMDRIINESPMFNQVKLLP